MFKVLRVEVRAPPNKEFFLKGLVLNCDDEVVVGVDIKNWSLRWSQKLDGIGLGRIRTFHLFPIPFTTPGGRLGSIKRIKHYDWFISSQETES